MCQDRNFGSLIQVERESRRGRLSLSSVVSFILALLETKANPRPSSLWSIHYVLTQSYIRFNYNCKKKNAQKTKKQFHCKFPELFRSLVSVLLVCLLLCPNTAGQLKPDWPLVFHTKWLQIWKITVSLLLRVYRTDTRHWSDYVECVWTQ